MIKCNNDDIFNRISLKLSIQSHRPQVYHKFLRIFFVHVSLYIKQNQQVHIHEIN